MRRKKGSSWAAVRRGLAWSNVRRFRRELARVFDGNELQIELELRPVRARRRGLGLERAVLEHVLQQRVEDRLVALDDAEDERRLPDDLLAAQAVHRAEAVVHERDARPDRLDRRRHDGDPLGRDVDGRAEEAELLAVDALLGQLALEPLRPLERRRPLGVQRRRRFVFGHIDGDHSSAAATAIPASSER